jgi:hypothetical protein
LHNVGKVSGKESSIAQTINTDIPILSNLHPVVYHSKTKNSEEQLMKTPAIISNPFTSQSVQKRIYLIKIHLFQAPFQIFIILGINHLDIVPLINQAK